MCVSSTCCVCVCVWPMSSCCLSFFVLNCFGGVSVVARGEFNKVYLRILGSVGVELFGEVVLMIRISGLS